MSEKCFVLGTALMLALLGSACGEDSGGGSASSANPQGAAGTTAPATTDTSNSATATGDMGAAAAPMAPTAEELMALADMFLPDCDPSVPTTANCGGVECSLNQLAGALCIVPCCAMQDGAEVCGTVSADLAMPGGVCMPPAPPAEPDARCPEFDTGMGSVLPGCCMDTGVCGVISSLSMQCITESPFITLPANPGPCDGSAVGDGTGDMTSTDPMAMPDAGTGDAAGTPDAGM